MYAIFCLPKLLCDLKQLISYSKSVEESEMVISGVKFSPFPGEWLIFHFQRMRSSCDFLTNHEHLENSVLCLMYVSIPSAHGCAQHYKHFLFNNIRACHSTLHYVHFYFSLKSSGRGVMWYITEYRGSNCNVLQNVTKTISTAFRVEVVKRNVPLERKCKSSPPLILLFTSIFTIQLYVTEVLTVYLT